MLPLLLDEMEHNAETLELEARRARTEMDAAEADFSVSSSTLSFPAVSSTPRHQMGVTGRIFYLLMSNNCRTAAKANAAVKPAAAAPIQSVSALASKLTDDFPN
jgi:hypothetical protein